MDDDSFIRHQIEQSAARERPTVIGRIVATCWPGGTADRAELVAHGWLRHWRPATANLVLPACSCTGGRCTVCN
ncbi:MAG TPA: hypothetical protein VGI50_17640 [Solirubrobacteraceae bacterium]|jgi:endonuclease YncB( thermonuclease family)